MDLPIWAQQTICLAGTASLFLVMQFRRSIPTDWLFLSVLLVFVLCGLLTPEQAWQGFSNPAIIAIAGLLVVSSALRTTGVLDGIGNMLLGNVKSEAVAAWRLTATLVLASSFLLNTALVAMMMPVVIGWCRRSRVPASRLLMLLSYSAILGGVCTLVGTSTNLVVDVELRKEYETQSAALVAKSKLGDAGAAEAQASWSEKYIEQLRPMRLLDITWVGLPCAIVGTIYLVFIGRKLLPNRVEPIESFDEHRREYLVELLVQPSCPLVGRTVEQGGLRHLPGLFLTEIERDGEILTAVSPTTRIKADDRLVFAGVVSTIADLEKIPGLVPASDAGFQSERGGDPRTLVEVVLSPSSPLLGVTIRSANFRQLYGAAVVAVHRNGQRMATKLGSVELQQGDTLLLQTTQAFLRTYRNRNDFYLVSSVAESETRRHEKRKLSAVLAGVLILWLLSGPAIEWLGAPEMLAQSPVAIAVIALAMVGFRCLPMSEAREALDGSLLLTIGGAIGIGRAMQATGAADMIARQTVELVGTNPYTLLIVIFLLTMVFTELLSNAAVAAIMFHIAVDVAEAAGLNPRPFVMGVMLAASLAFLSPIGYQTNLMVMGPGGYKPSDYVRGGLGLSILVAITAIITLPMVWPFVLP